MAAPTVAGATRQRTDRSAWPPLLVSAPGNDDHGGGGVLLVEAGEVELVDPVPTTGTSMSPDRSGLARLSWIEGHADSTELLISDAHGLHTYRRLDDVGEPHSLLWHDDGLHAVSTMTNSVVTLDEHGTVVRTRRPHGAPAHGDAWHLNSLAVVDGRLLVSAFGRFPTVRGWSRPGALEGAGVVIDVDTGDTVLTGLSAPHDPWWTGEGWLVCNSHSRELWRLDERGRPVARVGLGGWTRGLHVAGGVAYVGVSAHRLLDRADRAAIAAVDLDGMCEIERIELPTRGVFAITPADPDLVDGLRSGARLGFLRNLGSAALSIDTPLDEADCVVDVEAAVLDRSTVRVRVANRSSVIMSSLGAHPVRVGVRRFDATAGEWVDVARADLPRPLAPGRAAEIELTLPAPLAPGDLVTVTVLQERVRWFDEVTPRARAELRAT